MEGWIKLHRKFLNWEWYDDANTCRLFIHLLLKANHRPKKWHGVIIDRGQVLTGRKQLAKELKITERAVRTSLKHLISTNEVTIKTTNKYSIITINNYSTYQSLEKETDQQNDQQNDQQVTSNRPTSDQQVTTNKNDKNVKNEKNNIMSPKSNDFDVKASEILFRWNEFANEYGLAQVKILTQQRKKHLRQRLKEKEFDFETILSRIKESDFLLGLNKSGWKVSFDFVIRSTDTYTKILEGEYAGQRNQKSKEEMDIIMQNREILKRQGINPDKFPELRLEAAK